ncbi:hypothetical protein CPB83DRAFT_853727 [Crepidotus variabilis]|uniref:Uncharacterized protein n=1 Tax=Crepidotus variabilis TaxID=179855 RepID=A0A9P6EFU8_9AGAR|nr:hypothetical protein CPB83DRAFT_853727 [Crepidotus variabilis]
MRHLMALSPSALVERGQPVYDISGYVQPKFTFRTTGNHSKVKFRFLNEKQEGGDLPWPSGARGVFYYHVDPTLPPISGALRFRVCDSINAFNEGYDLSIHVGRPWTLSLINIAHTPSYAGLRQLILQQRLVDRDLVHDVRNLPVPRRPMNARMLTSLNQPLVLDLQNPNARIFLVTRKSWNLFIMPNIFYEQMTKTIPYAGFIKARFELSNRPKDVRRGPTLVLRVLELLTPIERKDEDHNGTFVLPQAGNLVARKNYLGTVIPWSYPLLHRRKGAQWIGFLQYSGSVESKWLSKLSNKPNI